MIDALVFVLWLARVITVCYNTELKTTLFDWFVFHESVNDKNECIICVTGVLIPHSALMAGIAGIIARVHPALR